MTDDEREICRVVNATPAIQSLLYDLNLLPEQTLGDAKRWDYTVTVVRHMQLAAMSAPAGSVQVPVEPTEEQIDAMSRVVIVDGYTANRQGFRAMYIAAVTDKGGAP